MYMVKYPNFVINYRKPVFITRNGKGDLPVEAGRYRLIVSNGYLWARRQLIVLRLLRLENAISVGRVRPRSEKGREFSVWDT